MVIVLFLLAIQWITCLIFWVQLSWLKNRKGYYSESITLIRPLYGLEYNLRNNIASCLNVATLLNGKVVFCLPNKEDPAYSVLTEVLESKPTPNAEILFGLEKLENPKLANLAKALKSDLDGLLIFTDSNVELDLQYLRRAVVFKKNVGLISAPPLAYDCQNFWADLESAFFNTHQGKWQYVSNFFGKGFAQGKNLVISTEILSLIGGLKILDSNFSEDAAFTKEIRKLKLKVDLMYPTKMALGVRSFKDVWSRQLRWSRLRRKTFTLEFLPEILTGGIPLLLSMVLFHWNVFIIPCILALFYLPEILLSKMYSWNTNKTFPLALLLRDLLIPILWVMGWGNKIVWKGHIKDLSCD